MRRAALAHWRGRGDEGVLRNPRIWIGLAASAASIAFLAREADPRAVWGALASSDPLWVLVCLATVPTAMALKVARWQLLLPGRASFGGLHAALYIGYFVSTIVPLRLGELARVYLAGQWLALAKAHVLATVFIEKLLDVAVLVLFLAGLLLATPLPGWAQAAALPSALLIVIGVAGLAGAIAVGPRAVASIARLELRLPVLARLHLAEHAEQFLDGTATIRRPKRLLAIGLWSLAIWLVALLTVYAAVRAPGIEAPLAAALLALVVTNLGMAVPSAPAYLGVFHGLVVLALGVFGVDPSRALGAAIILHACVYGPFVLGGLIALWRADRGRARLPGGVRDVLAKSTHE